MDSIAKRAKAQKELDELTALVFRWRWPAAALTFCLLANDSWRICSKFAQWSHLLTLRSVMAGTLYRSIGSDIDGIISSSICFIGRLAESDPAPIFSSPGRIEAHCDIS